jgi:hypothetical protein
VHGKAIRIEGGNFKIVRPRVIYWVLTFAYMYVCKNRDSTCKQEQI